MQVIPVNFMARDAQLSLARSFKEIGFAILINHSISLTLIEETHKAWKGFFSSINKYNFEYNKKTLDGYFPFGLEKARPGKYRDLKEFYYFYPWGKCPNKLRENTLLLYNELIKLGIYILESLENYLPKNIKDKLSIPLCQMIANTSRAVLRILHYPPLDGNHDEFALAERAQEGAVRAIEHEDLTLISIVTPIIGSGLQLKDLQGNWHSIPAGIDKLIINIGDMLELCTRGFYQATTHRVVNPYGLETQDSRYANAFFLNPSDDVRLDENHTALSCLKEHINKKLEYYEITPTFVESSDSIK